MLVLWVHCMGFPPKLHLFLPQCLCSLLPHCHLALPTNPEKPFPSLQLPKCSCLLKANSNPYMRSYLKASWTSPAHSDLSHSRTSLSLSGLSWDFRDSFNVVYFTYPTTCEVSKQADIPPQTKHHAFHTAYAQDFLAD